MSDRVIVTNPFVGVCHMQVCASDDATDEEILSVCNRENVSGTSNGWAKVIREDEPPSDFWPAEKMKPVKCAEMQGRTHFLVAC